MNLLGLIFALASAVVWGGGDFSGGLATRRLRAFQVLALSAGSGLVVLAIVAVLSGEPFPAGRSALFALLAGIAGSAGLASLYRGLSLGNAAVVAPTSGVLSAALPVIFTALVSGTPAPLQLAGFGLALAGIFLVSRTSSAESAPAAKRGFLLAIVAGLGFGAFFILIAQAGRDHVYTPLILARVVMLSIALALVWLARLPLPAPGRHPVALLAGALDAFGNVLYVLAGQLVRLDVAAVLASFYPATTVVLSGLILKEKVTAGQRTGVALCLAAIVLITL